LSETARILLSVRGISKSFGGVQALSAVSNAFCEMKFCLTSWALAWRVRSVVASCALADS
jgi:hypothetical protein